MVLQTLAQNATTKATQGDIVLWVAILIAVAFVGGLAILWIRKKLLAKDQPAAAGSLMDQLRGMLERGEITQAEFDATRRSIVKKVAAANRDSPAQSAVTDGATARPHSKQRPQDQGGRGPSA